MKYGLKLTTLMTDSTSYILLDSKEEVETAFSMFERYLEDEDEDANENWIEFCNECDNLYCDDDSNYNFMVGTKDDGISVIVVDDRAIEFELVTEFTERF